MIDLLGLAVGINAFGLPVLGIGSLLYSRLSVGAAAKFADRFFFAVLALVAVVTARTVIESDVAWLAHTMTLGVMIVGAVVIPPARLGDPTAPEGVAARSAG